MSNEGTKYQETAPSTFEVMSSMTLIRPYWACVRAPSIDSIEFHERVSELIKEAEERGLELRIVYVMQLQIRDLGLPRWGLVASPSSFNKTEDTGFDDDKEYEADKFLANWVYQGGTGAGMWVKPINGGLCVILAGGTLLTEPIVAASHTEAAAELRHRLGHIKR